MAFERVALIASGASALIFALAYFPIITRLSRGLASTYLKADVGKRFAAAAVDALLAATAVAGYSTTGARALLLAAPAYLLLRDGVMRGQSVGKLLFGLQVIQVDRPGFCSLGRSIQRNFLVLLPGVNVAAAILEAITITRDPLGLRLGDRWASTQVVEGKDARELVKDLDLRLLGGLTAERSQLGGKRPAPESPAGQQTR
jgi:uncharacterized RDD family membrane protein YckC